MDSYMTSPPYGPAATPECFRRDSRRDSCLGLEFDLAAQPQPLPLPRDTRGRVLVPDVPRQPAPKVEKPPLPSSHQASGWTPSVRAAVAPAEQHQHQPSPRAPAQAPASGWQQWAASLWA